MSMEMKHNRQTNLVVVLHALSSIVLAFHKHNILPYGEHEPSSPFSKGLNDLGGLPTQGSTC